MKKLLFALIAFFPLFASAQTDIEITSDSTFVAKPDTSFWIFYEITGSYTKPNGAIKSVPLYRADLVIRQGGRRMIGLTSGVLFRREYLEFIKAQVDQHGNEITIISDALSEVRDRKTALTTEREKIQAR